MSMLKAGRPSKDNPMQTLSDVAQKPEITRVSFEIEKTEHYKLKMYALKSRKTITQILRDYIQTLPDY